MEKYNDAQFLSILDSYGVLSVYKDGNYVFKHTDGMNEVRLNSQSVLRLARELIDMVVRDGDSFKDRD